MQSKIRRKLKFFITFVVKIIVAAVSFYFIFLLVDFDQLRKTFVKADYSYIIAGILLLPFNLGLRIAKWKYMLNVAGNNITWKVSAQSVLVGISLGSFTPAEFGDFIGKMLHLPDTRKSHIVGLTLLDKIQTMLLMAMIAIPTLFSIIFHTSSYILVAAVAILVFLFVFFLIGKKGAFLIKHLTHIRYIGNVSSTIFTLNTSQQVISFFYTGAFLTVVAIQMFCFLNAFYTVPLLQSFIGTITMLFLKSFVPISIADLGIREITTAYIFSYWLVPMTISINASLILFAVNIFIPACIGIVVLILSKQKLFHNLWSIF